MMSSNVKNVKTIRLNSSSNNNTNNSNNSSEKVHISTSKSISNDDEDEHFYDAPDGVDDVNDYLNLNGKSSLSDDVLNDDYDDDIDDDDDDDDEKSIVFFDTTTSRHASEISTNEVINNFGAKMKTKSTNTINEDSKQEESHASVSHSEENSTKKSETQSIITVKVEDEDDDEADADLETAWSFWVDRCFRGASKQDYEAGIKRIHTVKTVQTFWSVFNHIPDVSRLPKSYSYHLMRNDRRPLWEDPENSKGGLWKLKCKKEDTSLVWYELLLAGIGEQLSDCVSPCDDIIGLSVGCRDKDDIIQIWNSDCRYESEARVLERVQELVPNVEFSAKFYKPHNSREQYEGPANEHKNNLIKLPNHQNYQHYNHSNNNNSKIYKSNSNHNLKLK